MSYLALYRKYRPKKFDEIVGQEIVVKILKNALSSNKIGHAYIFSGTRGTGKTSIAKIFSRAVNCLNHTDGDICGKCEICENLDDNCTDIIEIDAASNNGVDEIREIKNNVSLMPAYLKYKVYIIDEVHMLSTSAFNALLKTLEEPPEHAIFILATTELNKIPATVLSRCQKLDFKKIPVKKIENQLKFILDQEKRIISSDVIRVVAELSDGSFRDAINLLDQLLSYGLDDLTVDDVYNMVGDVSQTEVLGIIRNIIFNNIKEGLETINSFYEQGKNFYSLSNRLQNVLSDIIINNNTRNYFSNEYENMLLMFDSFENDILLSLYNDAFSLSNNIKKADNQKVFFETYFIKMTLNFNNMKNQNVSTAMQQKDLTKIEEKSSVNSIMESSNKETNNSKDKDEDLDKSIYVNNALAEASKQSKILFQKSFDNINDYLTNLEYSAISSLIVKAIPEVVSERTVLFTFNKNFEVVLFDKNIELVKKLLKNIFNKNYELVAVSNDEWKNIKKKYIEDMNCGIKYEYKDIKKQVKKRKNSTELEKDVENIFGDDIISME